MARKRVSTFSVRQWDEHTWLMRHQSGYDEQYPTKAAALARAAELKPTLPQVPSFDLYGWSWKAQTGIGKTLYRVAGHGHKLSVRFSARAYDYATQTYGPDKYGTERPASLWLLVYRGATRVGNLVLELRWDAGVVKAIVVKSHLERELRGSGLGSGLYRASKLVMDRYAEVAGVGLQLQSMAEASGAPGATSDDARRVWDRMRGAGLLARRERGGRRAGEDPGHSSSAVAFRTFKGRGDARLVRVAVGLGGSGWYWDVRLDGSAHAPALVDPRTTGYDTERGAKAQATFVLGEQGWSPVGPWTCTPPRGHTAKRSC